MLNYTKDLSNFDIEKICNKLQIPLNGVYMKDELTKNNFQNGNYVINLENSNQGGSHWCALVKKDKVVLWIDSFGLPCPENICDVCQQLNINSIYYNETNIQDIDSNLCGYFCIAFFLYCKVNRGLITSKLSKYVNMFYQNTDHNDAILKTYMNYYWKFMGNR